MKRALALVCAAFLTFLCFACGEKPPKPPATTQGETSAYPISPEEAETILHRYVEPPDPPLYLTLESGPSEYHPNRYLFHLYEVVADDPETSHTATYGWYEVDCVTGQAYMMDMAANTSIPIGNIEFFDPSFEEEEAAEEDKEMLFPGEDSSVAFFVRREGREYCIYRLDTDPGCYYVYQDLATGELLYWELEEDVISPYAA